MKSAIENFLKEEIQSLQPVSGGDIADSYLIQTPSQKLFVKYCPTMDLNCEANGLREIERVDVIRTPKVVKVSKDFLALEYIETHAPRGSFFKKFGVQFAKLHKAKQEYFGFFEDNYIGHTPQGNNNETSWIDFYSKHRLGFQKILAIKNGFNDKEFVKELDLLIDRLPELLKEGGEFSSVLHGDLWSGNFLCDENNNAVLIDPACYFGHREADLAMTHLFGGFSPEFYKAYDNEFPLEIGHEKRRPIYLLYHLLNHLNLFGSSYYSQVRNNLKLLLN